MPIGLTPADTIALGATVDLSWATFQPVAEVDVEVSRDAGFSSPVVTRIARGNEVAEGLIEVPVGETGLLPDVPYFWRARARDLTGESAWSEAQRFVVSMTRTDAEDAPAGPLADLGLAVAPNPTRGAAAAFLMLPQPGAVRLEAYDLLGRRVAVLHDGILPAGTHTLTLDASRLPSGLYLVRATTPSGAAVQQLTVVR